VRDSFAAPISESSQVADARRMAAEIGANAGFKENDAGKLALVITEIATNLIKHAGGGELIVRRDGDSGIEILALDKGRGIADVPASLRDGFSTAGGQGTGLGALTRLSSEFDIYSVRANGTAVLVHLRPHSALVRSQPLVQVAGFDWPKPGESVCGDAWCVVRSSTRTFIMIADGLGHGPFAAEAATAAVQIFRERMGIAPASMIEEIHAGLRSTRGAAVAMTEIDSAAGTARFAGVGNIAGAILSEGVVRNMVSHNGTAGHEVRKIQEFTYAWPKRALLVMHSDGLATHWNLNAYPGLRERHPSLIAGVLYRDFKRGRDDVTVVVGKESG
jgi:anti-sigma regulatory factor (Ser/Thr protein kinase)